MRSMTGRELYAGRSRVVEWLRRVFRRGEDSIGWAVSGDGPVGVGAVEERAGEGVLPLGAGADVDGGRTDKFGTYFRDMPGQDYADQRYYNANFGRFNMQFTGSAWRRIMRSITRTGTSRWAEPGRQWLRRVFRRGEDSIGRALLRRRTGPGSVRSKNGQVMAYFPWGQERTSTADGADKFGTYFRDMPGQDYADQRYYKADFGRFWTVDPGGIKTS